MRRRRLRDEDGANLMLLAGVVITVAFVTTSLTLAQVSSLEREVSSQAPSPFPPEWRFIRDRLESNLNVSIGVETKNETFQNQTIIAISETFRNVQSEKGYDVLVRLAGVNGTYPKTELSLLNGPSYDAYALNWHEKLSWGYDGFNDGILWQQPCPIPGPSNGCIGAIAVYVHMTDGASTIEEVLVLAVNRG